MLLKRRHLACGGTDGLLCCYCSAVEVRQRTMERQQEKEARLDAFLETTRARVGKDKEPGLRVVDMKAKGATGTVDEQSLVGCHLHLRFLIIQRRSLE